MGIFSSIKDAIFGKKAVAAEPAAPPPNPVGSALDAATSAMAAAAAAPPAEVDVDAILTAEAAGKDLNWRTSIVDLLKLLEIDSSLAARKQLAAELECPPELMADSAKMNTYLHKVVLARIAAYGGNVPPDLLD